MKLIVLVYDSITQCYSSQIIALVLAYEYQTRISLNTRKRLHVVTDLLLNK